MISSPKKLDSGKQHKKFTRLKQSSLRKLNNKQYNFFKLKLGKKFCSIFLLLEG